MMMIANKILSCYYRVLRLLGFLPLGYRYLVSNILLKGVKLMRGPIPCVIPLNESVYNILALLSY